MLFQKYLKVRICDVYNVYMHCILSCTEQFWTDVAREIRCYMYFFRACFERKYVFHLAVVKVCHDGE